MPRAVGRKSIEIVQVLPGASGTPTHAVEGWTVNAADPVPVTSVLVGVNGIDPAKYSAFAWLASSASERASAGERLKTLPTAKSSEPTAKSAPIQRLSKPPKHALREARERHSCSVPSAAACKRRVMNGQGPLLAPSAP